ncbi:putative E3 ubiquitin-protein ligase HIP1 isoform X1 [Canna indica]|uniref:RING-type E3 ubiquitin transferase n=1 Tax=Canna indica TaxID=4628 RepID=A0AAQ3QRD9_9LILI|nr:putative E3 ubiquitin-protein ligase HIP1 isoform X1 [Canna indica]
MQTAYMEHRQSNNQIQMSEMDRARIWNNQHDHRSNLGSGSSMFPTDSIASNGANPVAYFNPNLRSNDLQTTNYSSEFPRYVAANTGASHDCYMHLPSGGSTSQLPPHPVQHGFSYNQHAMRDARSNVNSLVDYERATYKRKSPANFMLPDRESRTSFHSAGSSSNPIPSTEILEAKPVLDSHCWTGDPISFVHGYRGDNASSSGEGSQRNVRSRHANAIHLDNISSGISSSSNFPYHFHSIAIAGGAEMGGQWSHTPVSVHPSARASSSAIGSFNHELNQPYVTSHASSSNMEIDGGYSLPLPIHSGPSPRGQVISPSSYGQRTAYRANPSYPSSSVTFEDVRPPRMEYAAPSRYSTPPSIVRQSHERNGRTRNRYNRFHSFSDEDTARFRQIAESVAMMDHSTFYDSAHFIDQHHDMRLDIDNMSYEELLALEERIGDVSTGLSEDATIRCLTEIIYCFSHDDCEEDSCPICLEAYKDRDCLGRLNCKHIFHSSCVKKWLLIKNICPICKSSALEDK